MNQESPENHSNGFNIKYSGNNHFQFVRLGNATNVTTYIQSTYRK